MVVTFSSSVWFSSSSFWVVTLVLHFLFVVVLPLAVTDELWVDSNSGVALIGANTGASFC